MSPSVFVSLFLLNSKTIYNVPLFSRRGAALVYEGRDGTGMAELIRLEERHGRAVVDAALKELGKKLPVNPKRSIGYLIGTVRRMGEAGE